MSLCCYVESNDTVSAGFAHQFALMPQRMQVGKRLAHRKGHLVHVKLTLEDDVDDVACRLRCGLARSQRFGQAIRMGQITPQTLVWSPTLSGWTAAAQVPQLSRQFGSPTPPPLPPS